MRSVPEAERETVQREVEWTGDREDEGEEEGEIVAKSQTRREEGRPGGVKDCKSYWKGGECGPN